jgi:hypothetical protein
MRSYLVRGATIVAVVALVVGGTAAAGWAKAKKVTPTMTAALSRSSITLGSTTVDTATVSGTAAKGSPAGSVTFDVCGPTAVATKCTSPNDGSAIVGLSSGANHQSSANVTIDPSATGWYCLLDTYSGDSHYKKVSDNATASQCLDVTSGGGGGGPYTPTITSALSPTTTTLNGSSVDNVTVTGNATAGSPTGSLTFAVCAASAEPTPCTAPNIGPYSVELTSESGNRSVAQVTIENFSTTGWYCFLDQYSGDSHYKAVNDNDSSTECLDVTNGGQTSTPTIKSALNPSTITAGGSSVDTVTLTGNDGAGSPTGSVLFYVCGPTAVATACTSPNLGPADVELASESGNRSTTNVTIQANGSGWYCFLDQYSGDAHYNAVDDNNTATECLDVTGTSSAVRSDSAATLSAPRGTTVGAAVSQRGAVLLAR